MSREIFDVASKYIGAGNLSNYTFDFKIEDASYLLIKEYDTDGTLLNSVRGDELGLFLGGLVFDADAGGGTVGLVDDLATGHVLVLLLANDEPAQTYEFKNKFDFTLDRIEAAFDFVVGHIQRIAYLAQRSVKLNDFDDGVDFDPTLPADLASNPGCIFVVNEAGDGFDIGPTSAEISSAESYAQAASVSATASAASATSSANSATASSASATASAASATASAVSAAAAAASAATAASNTFINVTGSKASPTSVVAGTGIPFIGSYFFNTWYIQGNGGAGADISVNPQIAAGNVVGQRLRLYGCSDVATVTLENGTGLLLNGTCILAADDIIDLEWNGTAWAESGRNT